MAAEDELALPQVPEAKPNDPEDVSWALSTAEAMWARGDHLEGIKWVRKAAEAASEVENDNRALELAKAASELATIVARRSRASMGGLGIASGAPTVTPGSPTSGQPASSMPTTTRSFAPAAPSARPAPSPGLWSTPSSSPAVSPSAAPPPPRSAPPLPSKASQPPGAPSGRAPPRPVATSAAPQGPQAGRGVLSNRPSNDKTAKPRRRSRENLENEARAAGVIETAPQRAVDGETAARTLSVHDSDTHVGVTVDSQVARKRRSGPDAEPSVAVRPDDAGPSHLHGRQKSAEEWDALPTQNLTGGEMDDHMSDGDRKTAFVGVTAPPVATAPLSATPRAPQVTIHDPEIQTTQAVRVVVWRDANGVHVAPAGTVVSAITIDAVLVVLEEGADLTAWLSQRER